MTSLLLMKSMLFTNALKKNGNNKKKGSKLELKIKRLPRGNEIMCRICDLEVGEIPIFDNIVHPNIAEDIKFFSGVTLDKTDGLSKRLCQNCMDLLSGCVMFREMCQLTHKKLINMSIKKEANVEPNMDYNDNEDNEPDYFDNDSSCNIFSQTSDECSELTCSYCSKNYFGWSALNNHMKKCKSKSVKEKLKKEATPYETKKKKEKMFLCDICGQTSFSNANLLTHMGIHEPVFPFKCELCPYQGRTIDLLKVHKRSHLVEKPYKCTQCPKATTTSSNLAKHIQHVHSTVRPHKCNYCEKAFPSQHDLKRHIRDIHLRQGAAECVVCFKKFNSRKNLRGHQLKVHKIKGERLGRLPAYLQQQIEVQNENQNRCENEQIF